MEGLWPGDTRGGLGKKQKKRLFFNGSAIKALAPHPHSNLMAVGTSPSEKKVLKWQCNGKHY